METLTKLDQLFESLNSTDDKVRYPAFVELQKITEEKVTWVYDKWYQLVKKLSSDNSYQRTIGFTLLANLSKSDTDHRLDEILDDLLKCTNDAKFITARQVLLNIWKIAINNPGVQAKVTQHLVDEWVENLHLKTHPNLIKQDIISSLRKISKITGNKDVDKTIERLIDSEADEAFAKKLRKVK